MDETRALDVTLPASVLRRLLGETRSLGLPAELVVAAFVAGLLEAPTAPQPA
jgi:hypothetical protein